MTAENPTDAEVRGAFGELFFDARSVLPGKRDEATRRVAALLIERGYNATIDYAAHRVGVEVFGWRWPDSDSDSEIEREAAERIYGGRS